MGFWLPLLSLPDPNHNSSDQAESLRNDVAEEIYLLGGYRNAFQTKVSLRSFDTAKDTLAALEGEILNQAQNHNRFPRRQYSILFNKNRKLKRLWAKLGTKLDSLLFLLTSLKKASRYNSGKIWKKLDDIIVEYEDIKMVLDEIVQKQNDI